MAQQQKAWMGIRAQDTFICSQTLLFLRSIYFTLKLLQNKSLAWGFFFVIKINEKNKPIFLCYASFNTLIHGYSSVVVTHF